MLLLIKTVNVSLLFKSFLDQMDIIVHKIIKLCVSINYFKKMLSNKSSADLINEDLKNIICA